MWIRLCRRYSTASWFQYITPYSFYFLHACCVYIHMCQCVSASISVCKNPGPPNVWAPHIIINPICRRALWAFTPTVQKATTQHNPVFVLRCGCISLLIFPDQSFKLGFSFDPGEMQEQTVCVYAYLCIADCVCLSNQMRIKHIVKHRSISDLKFRALQ